MVDKCGSVTVDTIRLHMGTAHMACDPERGGHHDQKGGIGNIVKEAPEGGKPHTRGARGVVRHPRQDVQRHVGEGAAGPILRRGRGFRRGVICLSEGFAFVSGAILRDGAFFLWAASLPVYFAPQASNNMMYRAGSC